MAVKPRPPIYHTAVNALGLDPADVLYVGDGSDDEISGAAAVGLRPVLVQRDLSNTYDSVRRDVDGCSGPAVAALSEILPLL